MKLLKSTLVLVFAMAMISCSSDDDNNNSYDFTKDNLFGKYPLQTLKTKLVKTTTVDGFDVTTTTESEGDTFDASYDFSSNNEVTKTGTYRITETKTQNGQSTDTTYIVVLDGEKVDYSVNESKNELTMDGLKYDVSNFTATGFKLNHSKTTEDSDGNERIFTKKLVFSK